ncbi:MAG: SIMPL domain-containing protein, partial [Candidatus Pacebacteria bacterium]|nr:SIMPL domain-containing protein [Candidatus Paceibacterota bacterium]
KGITIIYSIITITNNTINPTKELSFEGKSSITVEPDIAEFTINLSEDGTSTASAQAKLKSVSDKLFTSIGDLNIEDKDIQTANISSEPK